ncbi:hypothetical protein WIS52_14585 [Pseudonocardia nematodicida]|uniref:MmpS family membrane protein n=1 Tax=Pseudonocardia nematodicida TaxID=1206997 RepID=A0ABV1KB46_9PSEU
MRARPPAGHAGTAPGHRRPAPGPAPWERPPSDRPRHERHERPARDHDVREPDDDRDRRIRAALATDPDGPDTAPDADSDDDRSSGVGDRWPWVLGGSLLAAGALVGGYLVTGGAPIPGEAGTVRYELEGPGAAGHVFHTGTSGPEQMTRVELPWSADIAFGRTPPDVFTLSGSRGLDGTSGTLTCRITDAASGRVLVESTSDGEFASVQCRGFPAP